MQSLSIHTRTFIYQLIIDYQQFVNNESVAYLQFVINSVHLSAKRAVYVLTELTYV